MIHVPWVGGLFERIQNAALLTKERLLADFPYHDIRSAFAIEAVNFVVVLLCRLCFCWRFRGALNRVSLDASRFTLKKLECSKQAKMPEYSCME